MARELAFRPILQRKKFGTSGLSRQVLCSGNSLWLTCICERSATRRRSPLARRPLPRVTPRLCIFIAFMYGQGVGTERNLNKERDLLQQAVLLGHLWARVRLGHVLVRGRWGAWQRLRGLFMIFSGAICATYVASRNPRDERLSGHDVSHPFARLTIMPAADAGGGP